MESRNNYNRTLKTIEWELNWFQIGGRTIGFKKNIYLIPISIIICVWPTSCYHDLIESKFNNYNQAMKENYFDKGWIPKELVNKEMKNIYVKNDLDRNACIFSYHLSNVELEKLDENLIKLDQNYTERMNIKNSKRFEKDLLNLPKYKSHEFNHGIAIDKEKRKVYGWLN